MEFLLVVLIVVVWVSLYSHISKMNAHADALRKDIYSLKKFVESQLEEIKRQSGTSTTITTEDIPKELVIEEPVQNVAEESVTISVEKPVEHYPEEKPDEVEIQPLIQPLGLVKEKKKVDYEKYIGENLFGKIGILVLVVGMGLFVKYAIDKDWVRYVAV